MPKALMAHDWAGPWKLWAEMFASIGWGVYDLAQPTKAQVLEALADPEVMAVIQQGHGTAYTFNTGTEAVSARDYLSVMAGRPKPMFVYLEHCDALNPTELGENDWMTVLSKGDLSGIAFIGMRYYDEMTAMDWYDARFRRDCAEYIGEGYTIYDAWRTALISYPREYYEPNDWGLVFRGDQTIHLAEFSPKPRALVWKFYSQPYSDNPWWAALRDMGYHVIWSNIPGEDKLGGALQSIIQDLGVAIYIGQGASKFYASDPEAGDSYRVRIRGIQEPDFVWLTADEIRSWLQGKPKPLFVYLEHSNSMMDTDPFGNNWVGAFSQGDLSNMVIIGGVGEAWNYGDTFEAWLSAFVNYLAQGKSVVDAGALASADHPASGIVYSGDGNIRLTEPPPETILFSPGEEKVAIAPIKVAPRDVNCEAELFLGPDENTKIATTERLPFVSSGASQDIRLPITMPTTSGIYGGYIDVFADGMRFLAYKTIADVEIGTYVTLQYINYYDNLWYGFNPAAPNEVTANKEAIWVGVGLIECTVGKVYRVDVVTPRKTYSASITAESTDPTIQLQTPTGAAGDEVWTVKIFEEDFQVLKYSFNMVVLAPPEPEFYVPAEMTKELLDGTILDMYWNCKVSCIITNNGEGPGTQNIHVRDSAGNLDKTLSVTLEPGAAYTWTHSQFIDFRRIATYTVRLQGDWVGNNTSVAVFTV